MPLTALVRQDNYLRYTDLAMGITAGAGYNGQVTRACCVPTAVHVPESSAWRGSPLNRPTHAWRPPEVNVNNTRLAPRGSQRQ